MQYEQAIIRSHHTFMNCVINWEFMCWMRLMWKPMV